MPEHVPHPVPETVAQPGNDFMRGMTVRAGITAVLDEGHVGIGVSEDVILVLSTGRSSFVACAWVIRDDPSRESEKRWRSSYTISGNMNGTPSRQPRESLIVLCPILRVDLTLTGARWHFGKNRRDCDRERVYLWDTAYRHSLLLSTKIHGPVYLGSLAGHELGNWDGAALERGITS